MEKFERHRLEETLREANFGKIRPIIQLPEYAGKRIVVVRGRIYWQDKEKWKFFSDFLFDYSNTIDTMSISWLHVKDLGKIHSDIFARDATCKSWGCHSGEMYSQWWKDRFDVPMIGAIGKTDFAHGGLPQLSNSDGKWAE